MAKKVKTILKLKAYSILYDAISSGLGFALNRLEDVSNMSFDDLTRCRALDPMMNEIMLAIEEVVDFDKSG